jgi:hypothetical protein
MTHFTKFSSSQLELNRVDCCYIVQGQRFIYFYTVALVEPKRFVAELDPLQLQLVTFSLSSNIFLKVSPG